MAPRSSTSQRGDRFPLVPDAIAAALGLVPGAGAAAVYAGPGPGRTHMLILLDTSSRCRCRPRCVASWRSGHPRLHMLVTSRVALRVRGRSGMAGEPAERSPAGGTRRSGGGRRRPAVHRAGARCAARVQAYQRNSAAWRAVQRGRSAAALELAAASMRLLTPEQMRGAAYERLTGPLADLPGAADADRRDRVEPTICCQDRRRSCLTAAVGIRGTVHG